MHIYEHMSDTMDVMWGNLMEADKYIREAHELKDECRTMADWYKDMALKHLEFNTGGKTVYERLKDQLKEDHEYTAHHEGIMMILDRQMAKLNHTCAEVKAKLEAYK